MAKPASKPALDPTIDDAEELGQYEAFDEKCRASIDQHVVMHRMENGRSAYVGVMPAHQWSPDAVRDTYGPGLYKFRLRKADQQWAGQLTLPITGSPKDPPPAARVIHAPAASPDLVSLLIQQQGQLMLEMVKASHTKQSGPALDLMEAIKFGAQLGARGKTVQHIEQRDNDDDDDDPTQGTMLDQILTSIIGKFLNTPASAPSPTLQALPSGHAQREQPATDTDVVMKTIEHLVRAATLAKAINADNYADVIIGAVGVDPVRGILDTLDDFSAVLIGQYPDLAPHVARLQEIEEAMRAKLFPEEPPA